MAVGEPMTVLVIALGSAGDVHPNVGLALALKRRGHRVVLVTSTVFAPLARRAGIEMQALGTEQEFYEALRDPDIWHPYRAFSVVAKRLILPMMREVYRIIESSSGSGDTIVAAPANGHLTGFALCDERDWRPPVDGLAEFLEAGDPPVVFTAGSAHAFSAEFFRVSVEACRAGGRRGILLTQFPEQLPAHLPGNVRAFGYVPFSSVLPRAAALVHHGGIGTTAQALAAAVPQLVVPFAHDQPDNAVRVRRLGVGDFLLPRRYKAAAAAEKLKRLIESATIGENCRLRARDLASSAPLDEACDLVEQAAGGGLQTVETYIRERESSC
jgi:UDP:flavonoid glycosyltransferase YjiC (YdhE family)